MRLHGCFATLAVALVACGGRVDAPAEPGAGGADVPAQGGSGGPAGGSGGSHGSGASGAAGAPAAGSGGGGTTGAGGAPVAVEAGAPAPATPPCWPYPSGTATLSIDDGVARFVPMTVAAGDCAQPGQTIRTAPEASVGAIELHWPGGPGSFQCGKGAVWATYLALGAGQPAMAMTCTLLIARADQGGAEGRFWVSTPGVTITDGEFQTP